MCESQRILLVRLGGLGDVVFTLSAVATVRAAFPQARITFLVKKEFAALLEGFRDVDAVIAVDRARYKGLHPRAIVAETLGLLWELRRNKFRLAVDFQGFGETALLCWWSGAGHRWGSVYRSTRKWAYTRPVWKAANLHPIECHLAVLRQGGNLRPAAISNQFMLPEGALTEARRFFWEHDLNPARPTLFIQPFTSTPHKNWPIEGYLASARHWRDQGFDVLFGGGPADRPALEQMRRAGFVVAAGTPVLVSAGLMKLSTLILGGDTGLLHLAVAMDKRVVMVMRSTQPGRCYPFGHQEWAVVPPSGSSLSSLRVEAVNEACARALAELGTGVQLCGSTTV